MVLIRETLPLALRAVEVYLFNTSLTSISQASAMNVGQVCRP